jgi:diaminopimelate decarboxylase
VGASDKTNLLLQAMNFCGLEKRNKDGNTALHLAVKSNSTSTVKEILKAAVDNFDIVLARNRLN